MGGGQGSEADCWVWVVLAVPPLPGVAGKGLQNCCPHGVSLRSRLDAMWGGAVPIAFPVSPSTGTGAWICLLSTPIWEYTSFRRRMAALGSINAGPDTAASLTLAVGSQGTLEGCPPSWA